MAPTIDLLDPFDRIQLGPFISQYSDWIIFTLFLFLFWAIAGIALRKRFEENRYTRALITAVALVLAVSTYFSVYRGWLHLSFGAFGLFGAVLIFIVIFFIIIGSMRGYGMSLANALSLGFALFYISLWAVIPNILHDIQENFPPVNGILLLFFIVSIIKIIAAFFRYSRKSPLETARRLRTTGFDSVTSGNTGAVENVEVEREEKDEEKEAKSLKKRTMKITKAEIRTLEDIETYIERMIQLIKEKGNNIDQEEISELIHILRQIVQKEDILKKGLKIIKTHVEAYQALHQKDISELSKRLSETKDRKQYKILHEELAYQKQMIQALAFLENYESKITDFYKSFIKALSLAMQKLKEKYHEDCLAYLEKAREGLKEMKYVYETQKSIEKYLLRLNKKTIADLKKEKKSRR
ncbi:membrane hypothetical protein [uncultured Desulfatiglans sp.]|nr:membrane hypothetical protein [uncultured Desulfatiglans sp.]